MSNGFKWNMLITSFLPLWISIIFFNLCKIIDNAIAIWNKENDFWNNFFDTLKENIISIIFIFIILIMCIISCSMINHFFNKQSEFKNNTAIISNIKQNTNLSADYLLAYILPMLVFDFTSLVDILLFVIYFGTLAFLCIRNNHVYVNIFLEFKKYKLYIGDIKCLILNDTYCYTNCLIISKNDLTGYNDKAINYYDFSKKIYIDLTEDK